jgi:hypothetical protein
MTYRAVAAILLTVSLVGFARPAAAAEDNQAGFSEIAGCISGAENVLISVVVDESLSLRETDPRALRVQGITTAIDSLEQLTETVPRSTNVEISMSTFARGYSSLSGWKKLNARTAQELRSQAARELPGRDTGDATDYRQALRGAQQQLDARQRQLDDPNACKVLLWFTDGALDVDEATPTAARELCQTGGVADAVRNDGIAVVALALFTPGAGVTSAQRDQLKAVAEGRGGTSICGTVPIPADSATGVYLPADDPAALQRLFAGAGALVAGGTEVDTVTCPGPGCPNGRYQLTVDPGVAGARVLVQGEAEPQVEVTTPAGRTLPLKSGQSQQVEGASVSYLVRDNLATINLAFDPYATSVTRWEIRPAGRSELSAYWFWGAQLSMESARIKAGAPTKVGIAVQDQNGNPLPLAQYRNLEATLNVGGRTVKTVIDPKGSLSGRVDLGVEDVPASIPVTATLSATTAPGDVTLAPISLSERLPVELPPAYPMVKPDELDFGRLEGLGTASSQMQLTGSPLGTTKVCVTGSSVVMPGESNGRDLVSPSSECVSLQGEETRTMALGLSPRQSVDGLASGEVQLRLIPADGSEDLELTVPLSLEMERAVDEGTRWALILVLLLLAILIPLILLIGSNLLLARYAMSSTSRIASRPVRVTRQGPQALDGSSLLEPQHFDNLPFSGTRKGREMPLGHSGITAKARRIFSFNSPEGYAEGPPTQILVSDAMPYRFLKGPRHQAPVELGEVDITLVSVDSAGATPDDATGTLVMAIPGDVDRQGIQDRLDRISSRPDWEQVLADAAGSEDEPTPVAVASAAGSPASIFGDGSGVEGSDDRPPSTPWGNPDADRPPPMPWDDERPAPESRPSTARKPRFARGKDKPSQPAPPPPPPRTDDDDDLPPMPDFLK